MTTRAMTSWIALAGLLVAAPLHAQEAVETTVQVRALARDAKLIGDAVGGARITITDRATGEVLASGVTAGATGNTDLIMNTPRERGVQVFDTDGAAGYRAIFDLSGPTEVEISAEGPLDYPQAMARASKTLLLEPGARIEGNGIVLELNGYIVELLEPAEGRRFAAGDVPVRARVRMLCSCPTRPDGLWSVERVTARLVAKDGTVVAEAPLAFSGETSVYAGVVRAPATGEYRLEVLASDPATANYGRDGRTLAVH